MNTVCRLRSHDFTFAPTLAWALVGMLCIFSLTGCKENPPAKPPTAVPKARPGPVEHIDSNERLQAAKLVETVDPIDREIKIFKAEVRGAFDEDRFEFLEETAEKLRSTKELFENGSWKLYQFYQGVDHRFHTGDDGWLTDLRRLEKWKKAYPESITVRIALADFWVGYGWVARGSGYANTVSEAQAAVFAERLKEAGKALNEAKRISDTDPYWYLVGIQLAMGAGAPANEFGVLVKKGTEIEPTFWGLDTQRAHTLLPRWYGKPGDWVKYAKEVAEREGGLGEEGYARVVIYMADYYADVFRDGKASWKTTKVGLEALRKKYPKSLEILSQVARLAPMGRDRAMAKAAFDELGDTYLESVWGKPERFVHFRTWAQTGQW